MHGDLELIEGCRRGDRDAWEGLIRRYRGVIYGIAVRWYGLSESEASDVFQEVCMALLEGLSSIEKPDSLQAWVMAVSVRTSRRMRSEAERHGRALAEEPALPAADADSPEGISLLARALVREAVDRMEGRCREIIQLRFFSESPMPYQEIAARLGLAPGSIGSIRARCFKQLQLQLRSKGYDLLVHAHLPV